MPRGLGSTPAAHTAKCCRRSAARLESPSWRPGGLSLNYPIVRCCCDLGESGVAASAGRLLGKLGESAFASKSNLLRRRQSHWQGRRRTLAPLPVDPCGGDGWGCAGLWCGRDARAPGGIHSMGTHSQERFGMGAVDPRRGDGWGCAGLWCGRDARAPDGGFIRWDRHTIGTKFGNKVADALWWRLWLCEVDSYSCKFVFIRGSFSWPS